MISRIYKIKRGKHRSTIGWRPFWRDTLSFKFILGETHHFWESTNQVNKIFGFSDGTLFHHKNSIRIGYTNDGGGYATLYAYVYIDGGRAVKKLRTIGLYQTYNIDIKVNRCSYDIYIDGTHAETMMRSNRRVHCYKHLLFPYFGGKVPAPRDLTYTIWKL